MPVTCVPLGWEHTNSHLHNLLFAVTTPLKRFNLGMGLVWERDRFSPLMEPLTILHFICQKNALLKALLLEFDQQQKHTATQSFHAGRC